MWGSLSEVQGECDQGVTRRRGFPHRTELQLYRLPMSVHARLSKSKQLEPETLRPGCCRSLTMIVTMTMAVTPPRLILSAKDASSLCSAGEGGSDATAAAAAAVRSCKPANQHIHKPDARVCVCVCVCLAKRRLYIFGSMVFSSPRISHPFHIEWHTTGDSEILTPGVVVFLCVCVRVCQLTVKLSNRLSLQQQVCWLWTRGSLRLL